MGESEWTPIAERHPGKSRPVRVRCADGREAVAVWGQGEWWGVGEDGELNDEVVPGPVVAWAPLPEG